MNPRQTPSVPEILAWIGQFLASTPASTPGKPAHDIQESDSFHTLGVDSAVVMEMVHSLGEMLHVEIDPTLVYDCRTVGAFAGCVQQLASAARLAA